MEGMTAPRLWGAGAVNLKNKKIMKHINDKFRKHRLGEINCLRHVKRLKAIVAVTSLTALAFCIYGMLLASITFVAVSFAGLALMARLYHSAEQHWFATVSLHRNLREMRAAEENRALGESTTRLDSMPLVNTLPPLADAWKLNAEGGQPNTETNDISNI